MRWRHTQNMSVIGPSSCVRRLRSALTVQWQFLQQLPFLPEKRSLVRVCIIVIDIYLRASSVLHSEYCVSPAYVCVSVSVCVSVPTRKNVKTSRPRRYVVEMYSSAATVALTPIVGFNFVIRSTFVMSYTYKAVSGYLLRVFTVLSQDYSCTSDLQNLK